MKLSNKSELPKATVYCLRCSFDSNILDVRMITETPKPLHYLYCEFYIL